MVALVGCGEPGDETTEPEAEARIDPDDCGLGSTDWPFDPENAAWRESIPDAPPPAGYSVPAVQLAGRIDGEAGASQGVASYRIPIVVAPGRAGLTPQLELRYTSSSQNGVAGVGWNLSGASRIHRCPRTQAQDGDVLPVSYTATDRLCLDGERLVLAGGTYGMANAEYRTELDSFVLIKQTGALDFPHTCFVAEHKDGSIATYGGCEGHEAAQVLPGASKPWAWAVRRITDARGNDMRFEYLLVRRYELDYLTSDATRRSLLQRVRTCASGTCTAASSLPATTFSYQHTPAAFTSEEIPSADPARERIHLLADYDGDGRRDRIRLTYPAPWGGLATGRVLELSGGVTIDLAGSPWTSGFDGAFGGLPGTRDVDFDSDGRADLSGRIDGTFAIGSWNPVTQQIETKLSNRTITGWVKEVTDLNADGTMDLLVVDGHDYTAHLQCPTSPPGEIAFCVSQRIATVSSCEEVARVADYDGNGIPDLYVTDTAGLTSACAGDPEIVFLRRNGGVGLASTTQTIAAMGGPTGELSGPYVTARYKQIDVTGDGLIDIVTLPATNVGFTHYTRFGNFDALGRLGVKSIDRASGNPIQIAYRYEGLDTYIRCTSGSSTRTA